MKFNINYRLSDIPKSNGLTCFSTFSGGGGSSIGYKLAGINVIGFCEITPGIAKIYQKNLNPKYSYIESIRDFRKKENYPKEIMGIDILDGSPPCTPFTSLKKNSLHQTEHNKRKVFHEGKQKQVLSDLIFEYIHLLGKLSPPLGIMENVVGLLSKKFKYYIKEIIKRANFYGYFVQIFKLDAKNFNVPQSRPRILFIFKKKNKKISIKGMSKKIVVNDIFNKDTDLSEFLNKRTKIYKYWHHCDIGKNFQESKITKGFFSCGIVDPCKELPCLITTSRGNLFYWKHPRKLSVEFYRKCSTFPIDYDFYNKEGFILGMCVPPFFMYNINKQITEQYF